MYRTALVSALAFATASSSIGQVPLRGAAPSAPSAGPRVPAIELARQASVDPTIPSGSPVGEPAAVPSGPPVVQQQPDIAPRYAPPAVNLMSRRNIRLTTRERHAVGLADDWVGNSDMPARGDEGAVVFAFGSTLPSVVCAPLYVCDVTLQAGETVNNIDVGDAVRWKVSPAVSGSGPNATTHVIVKPTDAALSTNAIITTDRRVYVLKLVSRRRDWTPRIAFSYPDDAKAEWVAYKASRDADRASTVMDTGQNVASLDFGYKITGSKPRWRPLRVYTDGSKTYVQFPASMKSSEAPALLALGADKKDQLVNYRLVGDRYVADKVLDRAVLISGVGKHQVKVEIAHVGGR